MHLLATRDSWWMTECEAALLAEGIAMQWLPAHEPGAAGALLLDVPDGEGERACEALSAQLAEDLRKRAADGGPVERWVPVLLQPAFAAALCSAVLLLFFFAFTGGTEHASRFFRAGALITDELRRGEWWLTVTAASLHADWPHAVGNAGFLLVLGWAANERFGVGIGLGVWLVTAIAGFWASALLTDVGLTVGASGGLFGLLGAAGGHALRWRPVSDFPLRDKLRGAGAAVLLLAFTAFSREANIAAHVGGFAAGFACGFVLPRTRAGAGYQLLTLSATAMLLIIAWEIALRHGAAR